MVSRCFLLDVSSSNTRLFLNQIFPQCSWWQGWVSTSRKTPQWGPCLPIYLNCIKCSKNENTPQSIENCQVMEGKEMKEILKSHSQLLDYISKHSGRPMTSVFEVEPIGNAKIWIRHRSYHYIFEICQLDYLYDTLLVETIYNKTLPEWTKVKAIN